MWVWLSSEEKQSAPVKASETQSAQVSPVQSSVPAKASETQSAPVKTSEDIIVIV